MQTFRTLIWPNSKYIILIFQNRTEKIESSTSKTLEYQIFKTFT